MATPLKPIARRALAAQSDDRLVRLLRDGHQPAFDEIVRRYRAPLVTFAAAIAGVSRSEDVVQAALMRAHAALLADGREIALRPWLFAIVRNGALNAVRDEPAWSELEPEQRGPGQPPATAEQREELENLVNAICALPEAQRRALVMREMEGVGHAEIAAKLDTSPTAVRGLIFRARTTVRNALGALIPLPILRWLLDDAAAAAAVTAAGTGTGGVLLGGALGKAAVGLTAAVVVVGAGKAIEDRRSGDERGPEEAAARVATVSGGAAGAGGSSGGSAGGAPGDPRSLRSGENRGERGEELRERGTERREELAERERDAADDRRDAREDSRDDAADAREDAADERDDDSDGGDDDSSSGGSSGSSGSSGSGHSGSGGDSGSSGSSGGDSDDDDDFESIEPDDEGSGSGSGSSGPGSDSDTTIGEDD